MITKRKLQEAIDRGELTQDFSVKELIQDAIVHHPYESDVIIYFYDTVGNRVKVRQKITDYLTKSEYDDVISLNNGY